MKTQELDLKMFSSSAKVIKARILSEKVIQSDRYMFQVDYSSCWKQGFDETKASRKANLEVTATSSPDKT